LKKIPLPSGERIKVRGDNYVADCRLFIVDWKNKKLASCCSLPLRNQGQE